MRAQERTVKILDKEYKQFSVVSYVLKCSVKIRLVDVPVIVVSPPIVAE